MISAGRRLPPGCRLGSRTALRRGRWRSSPTARSSLCSARPLSARSAVAWGLLAMLLLFLLERGGAPASLSRAFAALPVFADSGALIR